MSRSESCAAELSSAPWPGSHEMPQWDVGTLIDAPRFSWRNWLAMIGPGLLMAGAAIGGGEWLTGPAVTARFGASLMWLATLSILGQVIYNLEISRYTLYTGEPIFSGKFRTLPGPQFWLLAYLVLDFGAVFPYLAANAATPLAAMLLGEIPQAEKYWTTVHLLGGEYDLTQATLLKLLACAVFILAMVPLLIGGKVYNSLKIVMLSKIVAVFGFLLFVAICFSTWSTWREISVGLVKFGTLPVVGEQPDQLDNVFASLWRGDGLPRIDLSSIALLAAFAAIAGQGGLANVPLSNYTRDQGWGMGHHVGAIPSAIGGQHFSLSHVGMVFPVSAESLVKWRRWYRHVMRNQLVVWMPACFVGVALPSMLSLQFLPRGTRADDWAAAGMTAAGVRRHVAATSWGPTAGEWFWYLTLCCGFLVLAPTMASWTDGVIRRWVDVFWTASARLRRWEPRRIRNLYFYVLMAYAAFGLMMLLLGRPMQLLVIATNLMNFALGFSCFHVLAVNLILLPRELRPNWFIRIALVMAGMFFLLLAVVQALKTAGVLK